MRNHFIHAYEGNKRSEINDIFNHINFDNIKIIIEPFCGSSAFSFTVSQKFPGKFKYILNDNSNYLNDMYEILKDKDKYNKFKTEAQNVINNIKNKDEYNKICKRGDLIGNFIYKFIYFQHPGIYPLEEKRQKRQLIEYDDIPITKFLNIENVEFINGDALELIKKYWDNNECFIFIDPPYISSFNDYYMNKNINIYEYIYNNDINNAKCKMLFALEDIFLIRLLFQNNIKENTQTYNKTYQTTKRKTKHIYICNY